MKTTRENLVYVTGANFKSIQKSIQSTAPLLLIDFGADWCPPCRAMDSVIEELAEEFGQQAVIAKVNVEEAGELVAQFSIRNMPTFLIFKQGQLIHRYVGLMPKMVLADAIRKLLPGSDGGSRP